MAEFAFEPEPEVHLAPGETVREISGRSPWRIAGRRLVRNRLAIASLVLFLLIVIVSLLAPVYAHDVANTDPFGSNVAGTTVVNGKRVDVLQQGGGALGIGETPIGPTWQSNYFMGADNQGRDVMARVLYGGRASLQIGVASAVIRCLIALLLGLLAGFFRGWVDAFLSRLMDLIWAFPVYLLAISLATVLLTKPDGLKWNFYLFSVTIKPTNLWVPTAIIALVFVPYVYRPVPGAGALRARGGIRRSVNLARGFEPPPDVRRDPPQRHLDGDRAPPADDRDNGADGIGPLLPGDRREGSEKPAGARSSATARRCSTRAHWSRSCRGSSSS